MAELADALGSGPSTRKGVQVQVLSAGPTKKGENMSDIVVKIDGIIRRPSAEVAAQFADFNYHSKNNVHPGIKFTVHETDKNKSRFRQEVVLVGMKQVDEVVNTIQSESKMRTQVISGSNKDLSIDFTFEPQGPQSTKVNAIFTMKAKGIKRLLAPLFKIAIKKTALKALDEDRKDLESGRYAKSIAQ